jgi:hypothetical protein
MQVRSVTKYDHEYYVTPGINEAACVRDAQMYALQGETSKVHHHARYTADGQRLQGCQEGGQFECRVYSS